MREQKSSLVAHLGLATLSLVLFLTFLDNTVVSTTLANIQATLHSGVADLQWVVNAYALVFASFMLAAGALGDLFGRKRIMLAGVAVFCAGSVLAALAPNIDVLIAARAVMGLGAAASEPGTLSMIRHIYLEPRSRAQALGVWTAVSGFALAMGPVVGGSLVGLWSWRAVFWFNVFFGLAAFIAGAFVLPESVEPVRRRFGFGGLFFGAVFGVLTGIGSLLIAICGPLFASFPYLLISGEAQRRLKQVNRGLPFTVDLMALAMSAGLDFPIVDEIGVGHASGNGDHLFRPAFLD